MVSSAALLKILLCGPLVGFAVLLFRLYSTRLHKTYHYFSLYVLVELVRQIISLAIPHRSNAYAYFYFAAEVIVWTLCAMALLEVYGLVLRNHPGIMTLSRKTLVGAVSVSVMLSLCTLLIDYQDVAVKYPILSNFLLLSRLVMVSLLLFVLFMAFFLVWFPIPLNRNTVIHCCIFASYFLAKSGTFVAARFSADPEMKLVNAVILSLVTVCCVCWIALLTLAGESIPAKIGHYWDPEQEERLMAQLDSINRTLVHSAKD